MVKGVNKTVIEVNNTGSRLFEKIVFYVTPEYSNLSAKQLKRAAGNFSFNYENHLQKQSLRARYKRRRTLALIAFFGSILALIGLILLILL